MAGLLGYAAAGAAQGIGEGLVEEGRALREQRLQEANRAFQREERVATQGFQAGENQKGRDFQSGEGQKTRDFTSTENALGRDFAKGENQANRESQKDLTVLQISAADRRQERADARIDAREQKRFDDITSVQTLADGKVIGITKSGKKIDIADGGGKGWSQKDVAELTLSAIDKATPTITDPISGEKKRGTPDWPTAVANLEAAGLPISPGLKKLVGGGEDAPKGDKTPTFDVPAPFAGRKDLQWSPSRQIYYDPATGESVDKNGKVTKLNGGPAQQSGAAPAPTPQRSNRNPDGTLRLPDRYSLPPNSMDPVEEERINKELDAMPRGQIRLQPGLAPTWKGN